MQRADPKASTIREVLRWVETELERAGVASPRHDAERLTAKALGTNWSGLWMRMDDLVDPGDFEVLVGRRCGGEPLAYIEGSVVFCGLEMTCGPGVLVPRPETELLVEVAVELTEPVHGPVIVDVGTGSGAVAVALAARRPDATIFATDLSPAALRYARSNAGVHGARVTFGEGDLLSPLPGELAGGVDLIVSNPPYVPEGADVPADVRAEPPEAVFAGPRGDAVIRRLVEEAPKWLRPSGGALALEIGEPWQAELLPGARVRSDLTGRPRVAWRTM